MKKKMLYLSHVDWNWIKQRPQFLAEGLMDIFDVSVLYLYQNSNRKNLQKRNLDGQKVAPLYSIPLARRFKVLGVLNKPFMKAQVASRIKRIKPDYIFLTFPTQIEHLPVDYKGMVIYDCMDDHVALSQDFLKETVKENELKLLKRADFVLHSSMNLRKVLLEQYGDEFADKMHLIRNGYSGKIAMVDSKPVENKSEFTIAYIGTIGKWFNFDFIMRSLQDIPNLRYKLIGPADIETPTSDRIEYTGTVEHDKLYDAICGTDCLSMPFEINDIVLSVDPVKLYEYINYNMNILCVKYPEIERFDPFVYFYEDYESFLSQIKNMMNDNSVKYDGASRKKFLQESSWESRVSEITKILSEK